MKVLCGAERHEYLRKISKSIGYDMMDRWTDNVFVREGTNMYCMKVH